VAWCPLHQEHEGDVTEDYPRIVDINWTLPAECRIYRKPSLLEWARRLDPNGKVPGIVALLMGTDNLVTNWEKKKMDETKLPRDTYSTRLRELQANPGAVEKTSMIDLVDFVGNAVTWIVKTIRHDGSDTVFLQRQDVDGGQRWVLPAEVTDAIARQRAGAVSVNRRKGAVRGAQTRKAEGTQHIPTPPRRRK